MFGRNLLSKIFPKIYMCLMTHLVGALFSRMKLMKMRGGIVCLLIKVSGIFLTSLCLGDQARCLPIGMLGAGVGEGLILIFG